MKTLRLAEINSTNDYLKSLVEPEDWTVAIADVQNGGKGTKGKSFISPKGGLYMSIVFRSDGERLRFITPMAAVAVRRAIKETLGVSCGIKWVNDLYFNGKKVCGILTETKFAGDNAIAVVGIGVDVFRAESGYGEYEGVAGYLTEKAYDRSLLNDLAEAVRRELISIYRDTKRAFLKEYAANSVLNGQEIILQSGDNAETVTAVGIDDEARLIIRRIDGSEEAVINGDIIWKR